jgi:anti-sigma factor RsiW
MNQRDLELLSSYLDGEIKPSDSARLEARLQSDPELASVLNDLRAARALLRKLPQRRAPRNFTLTRKMVGQNPPLPRAYPAFRFVTALATLLFFFTFGLNVMAPQLASQAPAAYGMGGGGGGEAESSAAEAPVTEAPAQSAAPAPEEPSVALAPQFTQTPPTEEASRIMETPSAKNGAAEDSNIQGPPQPPARTLLVPFAWLIAFAAVAVLGALFMVLMRQRAVGRWRSKE